MKLKSEQNSQPLSLRRNFSWTFFGNLVYAGCQWGMLVVIAKLGTPEMVGKFTLGLAVTAPIVLFSNLQLRVVQATDAKQQYQFGDYLALRLITNLLALLGVMGITFAGGYQSETALVILIIGLAKVIESVSDIFYGLLQHHERMDRIAISMMLKGVLSLTNLSTLIYATDSTVWGVIGLTIAWALVLIIYDIPSSSKLFGRMTSQVDVSGTNEIIKEPPRTLKPRWHRKTLIQLAWVALPLGLVMMFISLQSNIPRYLIERYLGQRQLGIFAAMAYIQIAGNTIVSALGQSASPRLAKYYVVANYQAFRSLLLKLVGIGVILGGTSVLITVFAGRQLLTLIYQAEYAERLDIFIWLMISAGIGYIASFLGYGITSAQYFRIQLPLFISVALAIAITSFWLIPAYGLQGAALVLLIGAIVQILGSVVVVTHALNKLSTQVNKV